MRTWHRQFPPQMDEYFGGNRRRRENDDHPWVKAIPQEHHGQRRHEHCERDVRPAQMLFRADISLETTKCTVNFLKNLGHVSIVMRSNQMRKTSFLILRTFLIG